MRQLRAFDPAGQVPQQPDPHQAQHQHIQHTRAQNSQHKRRRFRAANILKYPKKDARPEEQRCAAERRYAEPAQRFAGKPAAAAQDAAEFTEGDEALFARLRALRRDIAQEIGKPPYIVFSDKTLHDMCAKRPRTPVEFLEVHGVGESKLEQYGERFLAAIAEFA